MPRVRSGSHKHRKHKKILRAAKGYYGAASRRYRIAKQSVYRAGVNATKDRKRRKREFRRLWITRISAACKQRGLRYSQFMHGLFWADIKLNRKMLSQIAIEDPAAFDKIVEMAIAAAENAPEVDVDAEAEANA